MDGLNGNRHERRNRNKIIIATWEGVRVYDNVREMRLKGWGGKMKNREEWRLIVHEAKAHPEL
jgi:hypothetical protein